MKRLRAWMFRLGGLIRTERQEQELADEMESHLQFHIEDNLRRGMTPEQARRDATLKLGGLEQTKQAYRERSTIPFIENLLRDVRYALRQLRKSPGFAITAILTLALGIGANSAVFSVVNGVVLRPLPYAHPGELVSVQSRVTTGTPSPELLSYPNFFDWRKQNKVFNWIVAYHDDEFTLSGSGAPEHLDGEVVSSGLFPLLGVKPALGRGFLLSEESAGTHVVVLSYRLWQRKFGADPKILGRTIKLDKLSYVVVGIAPRTFRFPVQNPDVALWTTIAHDAEPVQGETLFTERGARSLDAIARLKNGVRIEAARAQMDSLAAALAKQYPEDNGRLAGAYIQPELDKVLGDTRRPLFTLLGAVGLVLLIACANIASLLLLRTSEREREIAMRAALGAGRWRVIRQLLTENLLLALFGSAAGLFLGFICNHVLLNVAKASIPRIAQTSVDSNVFIFCTLLAILTTFLFSLPAVMQIAKTDLTGSLKSGTSKNTQKQERLRSILVVSQITLGLVLLSGAVLLTSSFLRLERNDIGVRTDHLLTFSIGIPDAPDSIENQVGLYHQILQRLEHLPGVISAAGAGPLPLTGDQIVFAFDIQGQPTSTSNRPRSDMAFVTPGYFKVVGTPLLKGRDFTKLDDLHAPHVVIVNKAFADRFFPGEDPIGKRIKAGPKMREIVGVVGNARQSVLSQDAEPIGYLPYYQVPIVPISVVLHTSFAPRALESTVRDAIASLYPQLPIYDVRTIENLLSVQIAQPRLQMLLLGTFAGVALLLTLVGLYGIMAYSVARRTREIGVRMALGADRSMVRFMFLKQAMKLVAFGVTFGSVGTIAATVVLRNMLYGLTPYDPLYFLIACCVMGVTGFIAAYIPSRRAAFIDPVGALRTE